jgi:hypothetical protein
MKFLKAAMDRAKIQVEEMFRVLSGQVKERT